MTDVAWTKRFAVAMLVGCLAVLGGPAPGPVAAAEEEVAAEAAEGDELHDDDLEHAGEDEHAEDHETPPLLSLDIGAAFWNLLIFLAVLAILGKFVWPNVLGGLQAREEKIRSDLESAEQTNRQAQELLAEYRQKLDEASSQVQSMLTEARRDAEASGQRIVEEAKQEADRQRERALADIDTAKKVAIADIAGQTSELAMQVARSVVGRELNPEDHADLIRQSLDRLPSNN